jgi:hypothetical protein
VRLMVRHQQPYRRCNVRDFFTTCQPLTDTVLTLYMLRLLVVTSPLPRMWTSTFKGPPNEGPEDEKQTTLWLMGTPPPLLAPQTSLLHSHT